MICIALTKNERKLFKAIRENDLDAVKLVVEHSVIIDVKNQSVSTILLDAASFIIRYLTRSVKRDGLELDKQLVDQHVNMEAKGKYGFTPLLEAVAWGSLDIVKYLVEKGSNVNSRGVYGVTPLILAAMENKLEIVDYLAKHGEKIDDKGEGKNTALIYASVQGNWEVAECLIRYGADINIKVGKEPLICYAAKNRRRKLVSLLIKNGADINSKGRHGYSALSKAVIRGDLELVSLLIENGADVNSISNNGLTPLRLAMRKANWAIIEFLIEKGGVIDNEFIRFVDSGNKQSEFQEWIRHIRPNPNYQENIIINIANILFPIYIPYKKLKLSLSALMKIDETNILFAKFKENIMDVLVDAKINNDESFIIEIKTKFNLKVDDSAILQHALKSHDMTTAYGNKQYRQSAMVSRLLVNITFEQYKKLYPNMRNLDESILRSIELAIKASYMRDDETRERFIDFYSELLNLPKDQIKSYINVIKNRNLSTIEYKMVMDVFELSKAGSKDFNIENISLYKDSISKDYIYELISSINYLKSNIKSHQDIFSESQKNDPNYKIFKPNENKENIRLQEDPQKAIEDQLNERYVFFRCIGNPANRNNSSIHNHTIFMTEMSKLIRQKGKPTLTKDEGAKDGNPNRSSSMAAFGIKLFNPSAGYIIDADIKDIKLVASEDVGSGFRKKANLDGLIRDYIDPIIDRTKTKDDQLKQLKIHLAINNDKNRYNEVLMDISSIENIKGIFYSIDRKEVLSKIDAMYMQWEFEQFTGKKLPLYKYSSFMHIPIWDDYKKEDVLKLVKENHNYILNRDSLRLIECFSKYIKGDAEFMDKTYQFLISLKPSNIFESINISRALKSIGKQEESDKLLSEGISKFLNYGNIVSTLDNLLIGKGKKRPDKRVVELFEILGSLKNTLSRPAFYSLKPMLDKTFSALCDYEVNKKNKKAIIKAIKEYQKRFYLGYIPEEVLSAVKASTLNTEAIGQLHDEDKNFYSKYCGQEKTGFIEGLKV